MGQYKVPQNVEAEDKIIGALTLKQFIYTVMGVMYAALCFFTLRKVPVVMLIVAIPPTALFLLLGLYQRQDQPFEALFISLVGYLAKPRQRLWLKEPIEEVFKIEPPKVVKTVTQRNPEEVRGQLERLSQVVDSRGWGNKSAALQEPTGNTGLTAEGRIIMPEVQPEAEPLQAEVSAADDILDFDNNPNAHNLGGLIINKTKEVRQEALNKLRRVTPKSAPAPQTVTNVGSADLTTEAMTNPIPPNTTAPAPQKPSQTSASEMTLNPLDDMLKLAMETDGLPVSQVAAKANRDHGLAPGQSVSLRPNGNRSE